MHDTDGEERTHNQRGGDGINQRGGDGMSDPVKCVVCGRHLFLGCQVKLSEVLRAHKMHAFCCVQKSNTSNLSNIKIGVYFSDIIIYLEVPHAHLSRIGKFCK